MGPKIKSNLMSWHVSCYWAFDWTWALRCTWAMEWALTLAQAISLVGITSSSPSWRWFVLRSRGCLRLTTTKFEVPPGSKTNLQYVDMRRQGGWLLEDLMKIEWSSFELSWSHYHWNEAYIDEGKEIWWYPWWSRLEYVFSM